MNDRAEYECPFCGQEPAARSDTIYPVIECPCGAAGTVAPAQDLDEAGDELLQWLGLSGISPPAMELGTSGFLSGKRYDADATSRDLVRKLTFLGLEVRTRQSTQRVDTPPPAERDHVDVQRRELWVRRAPPEVFVQTMWACEKYEVAGRILYESLPEDMRPGWAVSVLRLCWGDAPMPPPVAGLFDAAAHPMRWARARGLFTNLRQMTLELEKKDPPDQLRNARYLLAENVAKVVYNASRLPAPYDHDAGWVITPLSIHISEYGGPDRATIFETLTAPLVSARH